MESRLLNEEYVNKGLRKENSQIRTDLSTVQSDLEATRVHLEAAKTASEAERITQEATMTRLQSALESIQTQIVTATNKIEGAERSALDTIQSRDEMATQGEKSVTDEDDSGHSELVTTDPEDVDAVGLTNATAAVETLEVPSTAVTDKTNTSVAAQEVVRVGVSE